jgi:hypothetical protein
MRNVLAIATILLALNLNMLSAQSIGPGKPVRSELHEQLLNDFFRKLSHDSVDLSVFSSALFFGPAFYQQFGEDNVIKREAIPVNVNVPIGDGKYNTLKSALFKGESVSKLFSSPTFVAILKLFCNGVSRMADQKERDVFYSLISYEIESKPITVFQKDKLILLFDFADDHIIYIDLISSYSH